MLLLIKINVVVGGQDGYNGGGTGMVSNGGGATDLRINGERIAIAGGGGGGTAKKKGGAGGASDAGNNGELYFGTSKKTTNGSAGGGGGYYGGKAGAYYTKTETIEYTVYWNLTNDLGITNKQLTSGATEFDDTYTFTCHEGEYSIVKTEPESDLSATVIGSNKWNFGGSRPDGTPYYFNFNSDFGNYTAYMPDYGYKENIPQSFTTSYKKTNATINVNEASKGGSSWFDITSCINGNYQEGIQEGHGSCLIKILSLYNLYYQNTECFNVYYAGVKAKKIYYNGILIYQE